MPKSKRKRRSNTNSTGSTGVNKTSSSRYSARIKIDGKYKYLGSYDTPKQAGKAYDKEAIRLGRPFAKLNYPKEAPADYTPIQQKLLARNTVGYRGVSKNQKKFAAGIYIDKKKAHLGNFCTAKEAAIAYDRAVLKSNQSTTLLNFPDMVHNLDIEPKRKKYKHSSNGYPSISRELKARMNTTSKTTTTGTFESAVEALLTINTSSSRLRPSRNQNR